MNIAEDRAKLNPNECKNIEDVKYAIMPQMQRITKLFLALQEEKQPDKFFSPSSRAIFDIEHYLDTFDLIDGSIEDREIEFSFRLIPDPQQSCYYYPDNHVYSMVTWDADGYWFNVTEFDIID